MQKTLVQSYLSKSAHAIEYSAVRASGAGGQNVNKVSTAVQLRFKIRHSAFPLSAQEKILLSSEQKLSSEGEWIIFSQESRSQEQNKLAAWQRLLEDLSRLLHEDKKRKPTKATYASKVKRLDSKKKDSSIKKARSQRNFHD